jgi:integrase
MASAHPKYNRDGKRIGFQARWRDPDTGRQRSKLFPLERQAKDYGNRVETSKADGLYVDPSAGAVTFQVYAEQWQASQVHRSSTATQIESYFRRHVFPCIGSRPLSALRPSELQTLVKAMSRDLAPSTIETIWAWVGSIFKAAVADRLILSSPVAGVGLPTVPETRVTVLPVETVVKLADAMHSRYRAAVVLGAGAGPRIAEAMGLTVDRVDWFRKTVTIDRQLMRAPGREPTFGPLKDKRDRARVVPVGQTVLDELARHLATYGEGPSGLISPPCWGTRSGTPRFRTTGGRQRARWASRRGRGTTC